MRSGGRKLEEQRRHKEVKTLGPAEQVGTVREVEKGENTRYGLGE